MFLCLVGTSGDGRVRRGLTLGEDAAGRALCYAPVRLARQKNRVVIQNKNTLAILNRKLFCTDNVIKRLEEKVLVHRLCWWPTAVAALLSSFLPHTTYLVS